MPVSIFDDCGFAGAVRAEEPKHLAPSDLKADAIHSPKAVKIPGQPLCFDRQLVPLRLRHRWFPCSAAGCLCLHRTGSATPLDQRQNNILQIALSGTHFEQADIAEQKFYLGNRAVAVGLWNKNVE